MTTGTGSSHKHILTGKQISSESAHMHSTDAIDAALADLTARVTALEQPVPVVPSLPIVITTSNVTVENKSFSATSGMGTAIDVRGTLAAPVTNLTIRRCTFSGFTYQVFAAFVNGLIIEDCTFQDATIAGIEAVSCVGGSIARNTVRRIGVGFDANPPTAWNAYGITVTSDPGARASTDIDVDANVVEDVPTWIGINVHTSALRVKVTNNTTRRVRRPYFFAPIAPARLTSLFVRTKVSPNAPERLTSMTVTGNRAESAGGVTPGEAGIFINRSDGCAVTGNFISTDYPHPADGGEWLNYVLDHDGLSTGLTRSGNTLI